MNEPIIVNNLNHGGIAESKYSGRPNSVAKMIGLDVHSEPGVIKVNQKLKKESGSTVGALIKNIVVCSDGNSYFFSFSTGRVWKRTSDGVWSIAYTTVPTDGNAGCLGAIEFEKHIYWATQNFLHRISLKKISNWATGAEPNWAELHKDQEASGSVLDTYDLTTGISENTEHQRTFTPQNISISGVKLNIDTVGTGNWTVVLHDSANTLLGTKTIANGDLSTGETLFQFASAIDVDVEEIHHIHVYSSVADGKLKSYSYYSLVGDTDSSDDYDTGTAIVESSIHQKVFIATNEHIVGVQLSVKTVGSGDWTVTMHDADDNVKGTCTIVNGSMSTGLVDFELASAFNATIDDAYHFHVTTTVADGYVNSGVNADLSKCRNMILTNDIENCWAAFYTAGDTEFHPMKMLNNVLYIGDRNYIHQVELGEFTAFALDIPAPNRVKCLDRYETDLIIGTIIDSSINNGMVYRWNTWSVSWSSEDDVNEVGVNAFFTVGNFVFAQVGLNGNIYSYNGAKLEFYQQIPGDYSSTKYGSVNPNAVATFKNMPVLGFSNGSGNPTEQGIYSLATKNPSLYPRILGLDYVLSDDVVENIEIGAIVVIGNILLVSWKNNAGAGTYGVDVLDTSNKYNEAFFETRIISISRMTQFSFAKVEVGYVDLPADTDIEIYVKKNYASSWGTKRSTVNDEKRKVIIADTKMDANTFQVKIVLKVKDNTYPIIDEVHIGVG